MEVQSIGAGGIWEWKMVPQIQSWINNYFFMINGFVSQAIYNIHLQISDTLFHTHLFLANVTF